MSRPKSRLPLRERFRARWSGCGRRSSAERMLAPENVPRILIESLDSVGVLERTLTPRAAAGDVEALKLVAQCRRQREGTAKLILERAPTSNPV